MVVGRLIIIFLFLWGWGRGIFCYDWILQTQDCDYIAQHLQLDVLISYLLRQYFLEHCSLFVAFVYLTFHMHVYSPNRKQNVILNPCLFKLCWNTITGKLHIMYILKNLNGQSFLGRYLFVKQTLE